MLKYLLEFDKTQGWMAGFALALFVVAFVIIVIQAIQLDKTYLQKMEKMPLEGDESHVATNG